MKRKRRKIRVFRAKRFSNGKYLNNFLIQISKKTRKLENSQLGTLSK